jgi:hypothetical protein
MPNTSATGGFIVPEGDLPANDDDLIDFLQEMIVGVTGLDPALVRPRWQPEPPNVPAQSVDWVAAGVRLVRADAFPYVVHDPDGDAGQGTDKLVRNEILELFCSFYGPHSQGYAARLRDGMFIAQNREALTARAMNVIEAGEITRAGELVNNLWRTRDDFTLTLGRQITLVYPVRHLLSGEFQLTTQGTTTTDVTQ